MRSIFFLSVLSFAFAALGGATAPEVFVDPVAGVDAPGQGSQAAPYRSIRYALAQNPGPVLVQLAPGTYTSPLETFPLVLGAGDSLRGPAAGGARIVGTGPVLAAPYALVATTADGGGMVQLEHLAIESAGTPLVDVDARTAADGTLTVQMRDCSLRTNGEGVRLRTSAGVSPPVVLEFTRLDVRVLARAFDLLFAGGTIGLVSFDNCFVSGQASGVWVRVQGGPAGPANVWASATGTVFERCSTAIISRSDGNGKLDWDIDRCVFAGSSYALCPEPLVPLNGAILDLGGSTAGNLTYTIVRSIFWYNWPGCAPDPAGQGVVVDLGSFRAGDYVVDRNVIQQPPPPSGWNGSNRSGDPRWFQFSPQAIGVNDYHLLAGSPAIDCGAGDPHTPDFEGDSAALPCGDGTSDAGVDEHRARDIWLAPAPTLGEVSHLRLLGPPQGWAVVYGGTSLGTSPCDGTLGIVPHFPMGLFVPLDADGKAEVPLPVPSAPALAGLTFAAQGLFATPEGHFGGFSSVREFTLRR